MSLVNLLNFYHSNSKKNFCERIIGKSPLSVISKSIYAINHKNNMFSLQILSLVLLRQIYCINLQFLWIMDSPKSS